MTSIVGAVTTRELIFTTSPSKPVLTLKKNHIVNRLEMKADLIHFSFPWNFTMTLQIPTLIFGNSKWFLVPMSKIFWSLNKAWSTLEIKKTKNKFLNYNSRKSQAFNFIKKETVTQAFSCEFCKISKKTFSYRTPPVAAFVTHMFQQDFTSWTKTNSVSQKRKTS